MHPFSHHGLIASFNQAKDREDSAKAPFSGIECLQTQSFLILTDRVLETHFGPTSCRPLKIFGWDSNTRDFTLCLFDVNLSDLENYAEFLDRGNHLLLYQCHSDTQICYSYQPYFGDDVLAYPTQYRLQVFVCGDDNSWDLIAEGEYC